MTKPLADNLQLWGFEDELCVFSDGSIGFCFELNPTDTSCWDDDRINMLADNLRNFLNGLPANLDFQITQDIKGGFDRVINAHQSLGKPGVSDIAKSLCNERVDVLNKLDKSGSLSRHKSRCFVRLHPKSVKTPSLLSILKPPKFVLPSEFEAFVAHGKKIRMELTDSLRQLGLDPKVLEANEIADIIYEDWNPLRKISRPSMNPEEVRSTLLFTDVGLTLEGFNIGGMHHRTISLKLLPESTVAGMAAVLQNLPFESRLLLSIKTCDQQKEIETLQTQRRLAYSMVSGKRDGVRDLDSQAKFDDLEDLLEQMISGGEKIFWISLQVILRDKSEEILDGKVRQTLMLLREMAGAEGMTESLASFDIFLESSPPNAQGKIRAKRMKTSNVAAFLPIYAPWPGHARPSIILRNRLGGLVSFDPFDQELSNSNQLVSGGSGAGKSFATNLMLLQMLKEDPKIFIIDIGGSYQKICETLGGQYIPLSVGQGLALNPFDLPPGEDNPSEHKIKFLVTLVEIMTKENDKQGLGRYERAELETLIMECYRKNKTPQLSDLRSSLILNTDANIVRLGKILASWCRPSPYGQFVDNTTTISLDKPIICFDLKGMESYPDLQAVCLFIMTDFIWHKIQQDRGAKKFLVFDECWKLLEDKSGAEFLGEVFRTFRKYHASAIAISQTMDDFAQSSVANAILPNSSVRWILRQKGADQQKLQEVLQLNDHEMKLISSLGQVRGQYSEAFLMAGDQRIVVAIESTPLEYWIATTDPRELSKIQSEMQKNPSLDKLDILKNLAHRFPNGLFGQEVKS